MKLTTITFPMTTPQATHIIAALAHASRGPVVVRGSRRAQDRPPSSAARMARAVPNRRPMGRATSAPRTPPTPDSSYVMTMSSVAGAAGQPGSPGWAGRPACSVPAVPGGTNMTPADPRMPW
jgi:hypothetical protein